MKFYNKQYDAYHDENYVWLEKPCSDLECPICTNRPKLAPVNVEVELRKDYANHDNSYEDYYLEN